MSDRLNVVRDFMRRRRLDALILEEATQVQYLFEIYRSYGPDELRGMLLVQPDGLTFVALPLTLQSLDPYLPPEVVRVEADVPSYVRNLHGFDRDLARLVRKHGLRRIGAFTERCRPALPAKTDFKALDENPLIEMADTRTEREIRLLERAVEITDAVFARIVSELRPQWTELRTLARIDELLYEHGADLAHGNLVSFGENTRQMHAVATNRPLRPGDWVMLDFGPRVGGMPGDLTRTFVFGKATAEQRSLWKAVLGAQKIALELVRPGKQGHAVSWAAFEHLQKAGYGKYYRHTLGHQLGMLRGQTRLAPKCTRRLRTNMALTVEPGAYTPAGGVRIEDNVIVTPDGPRVLTRSPKFLEIPAGGARFAPRTSRAGENSPHRRRLDKPRRRR